LGKIECEPFDAADFSDAHSTTYRVVASHLNYLAILSVAKLIDVKSAIPEQDR
jgi:hypothetical protein